MTAARSRSSVSRFTLRDASEAVGGHEAMLDHMARQGTLDRTAFLDVLFRDIDQAIRRLEADAKSYVGASEDLMTRIIVAFLEGRHYRVTSDINERGHVDLQVVSERVNTKWNAEAKIHGDYEYALEGIRQLVTRYATGFDKDGGLLLYVTGANALEVSAELQKRIAEDTTTGFSRMEDDECDYRFRSIHRHASGTMYRVRHHIVLLHYYPEDKSARRSRAKAAARAADEAELDEQYEPDATE